MHSPSNYKNINDIINSTVNNADNIGKSGLMLIIDDSLAHVIQLLKSSPYYLHFGLFAEQ